MSFRSTVVTHTDFPWAYFNIGVTLSGPSRFYPSSSCGSVIEHCVSSKKGCGFNSQETHKLTKKFIIWLHCKSLWIIASAKCIHLNVHLFALKRSWLHRDVKYLLLRFKGLLVKVMWCNTYSELVLCIYPIHSAPTQQWTHTHSEHTPGAVGSHLCWGARGAVGGLVPCYWRWQERCTFTPPTYNSLRIEIRTRNLSIMSPTLTIRPCLPLFKWSYFQGMHMLKINISRSYILYVCVCMCILYRYAAGHEWSLWWGSQLTREPTKVSWIQIQIYVYIGYKFAIYCIYIVFKYEIFILHLNIAFLWQSYGEWRGEKRVLGSSPLARIIVPARRGAKSPWRQWQENRLILYKRKAAARLESGEFWLINQLPLSSALCK